MKSYKNLKLKIITLLQENNVEVSADENKDIGVSLKRSKKKEEYIFKAINTRIENLQKKSEQEKSRFRVSEFIDFISKNTPKDLAEKEAKKKSKEQIKQRRKTWNCFYNEHEIKHLYNQLQSIVFHAKMSKFTDDEKEAIIVELKICSLSMDIIFTRVINRVKQIKAERMNHIKLAHYLARIDRENTKPFVLTQQEILNTTHKADEIVKKFFKEYFVAKGKL